MTELVVKRVTYIMMFWSSSRSVSISDLGREDNGYLKAFSSCPFAHSLVPSVKAVERRGMAFVNTLSQIGIWKCPVVKPGSWVSVIFMVYNHQRKGWLGSSQWQCVSWGVDNRLLSQCDATAKYAVVYLEYAWRLMRFKNLAVVWNCLWGCNTWEVIEGITR